MCKHIKLAFLSMVVTLMPRSLKGWSVFQFLLQMIAARSFLEGIGSVGRVDPILYLKSQRVWPPQSFNLIYEAIIFIIIKSCKGPCPFLYIQTTARKDRLYIKHSEAHLFKPLDYCPICFRENQQS